MRGSGGNHVSGKRLVLGRDAKTRKERPQQVLGHKTSGHPRHIQFILP
jgi:hypothetical protein